MTDDEAFESALDEALADVWMQSDTALHSTPDPEAVSRLTALRQVYADWLEERGDLRAAFQRWLVHHRKFPRFSWQSWDWWRYGDRPDSNPEDLPIEIWKRLPGMPRDDVPQCKEYPTRRSAERALFKALVWMELLGDSAPV